MAENHVAHHIRRAEGLESKLRKLKERGAKVGLHARRTLEVSAGALLGGAIQGMAKDPSKGATILGLPADLTITAALKIGGIALDFAGEGYGEDLSNLGDGFLGAALSDIGFHLGAKRKATGSFFGPKVALPPGPPPALPAMPPAAVAASGDPQAMAAALLQQMQR